MKTFFSIFLLFLLCGNLLNAEESEYEKKVTSSFKKDEALYKKFLESKKQNKDDVTVSGNIEWGSNKNEYPKYIKGLYWQDDRSVMASLIYKEAIQQCKNLGNNFRLPTENELKTTKGYLYKFHTRFYNRNDQYMGSWGSNKSKEKAVYYDMYDDEFEYVYLSHNRRTRCVREKSEIDKLNVIDMAIAYTQKDIKNVKLILPKKPTLKKIPNLVKGEFEKTETFKERVTNTKLKIEQENKKNLEMWEFAVEQHKKEHKNKLQLLHNNSSELLLKNIVKALHLKYGVPKIISAKYNADDEKFNIILGSDWWGGYEKNVQLPVKLKYAKKFKEIMSDKNFKPTIEFEVINNKLVFSGIKEIKDPESLVEENEYNKALNIRNNEDSLSELEKFIVKYPNSTLKSTAESRIKTLKEEIFKKKEKERIYKEKRAKEDREAAERRKKAQERKQQSFYAKKYVGDEVCMDGTTSIFLSITIKAYVEQVNGDNIQLRIAHTEGTTPHYNGVSLSKNTLIWDSYSNWYKCNY